MILLVLTLLATCATLAAALHWTRARLALTEAALREERLVIAAARALYGEARMREAARGVAMRERTD